MKYSVKDFTLEEKLKLLTGKSDWTTQDLDGKLPSLWLSDGPNGLRKIELNSVSTEDGGIITSKQTLPATAMPTLSVVANTWNKEMAYLDGKSIADECIEYDVDVLLAPGVNIKRNVLNGRNFEYFSEDPFLTGKMARAFVEGVQDKGVGTSVKHYLANNSENDKNSISSEVDERTLREIYLPAFEECVKAKPWTVMAAYNRVNGVYACQNRKMLKKVLRDDLGFDGLIVSDWNAIHNHVKAVKATCDLRMPYREVAYTELLEAFNRGELTEEEIDACAQKVLDLIEKKENAVKNPPEYTKQERHQNAVEIAKEGMILLKNEDNILPIKNPNKLCVLGRFNAAPVFGGGGSSRVVLEGGVKPLSTLLEEKLGVEVYSGRVIRNDVLTATGYFDKHLPHAYDSDVTLICVGEQPPMVSEGFNRESIKLSPAQEDMILKTSKVTDNIVVLVYAGSVIDMSAWIDKVKAVVYVGYAGEGVQEAVCSVITGETVPSGKTNETFPLSIKDTVTKGEFDDGRSDWYKEGIFVGYRHYDREGLDVLYPFGHGLSYANFEYSNLTIEQKGETDFTISYDIKNTSNIDAKEVSEVYVKDMFAIIARPERELKGFSKDLIKAGETKRVSVDLDFRSFAYYSTTYDNWVIDGGTYEIQVGASSRNIKLVGKIKLAENISKYEERIAKAHANYEW